MAQYKICKKCNLEKEIILFSSRKISKDGYLTKCKECIADEKKNYFLKNKKHLKDKTLFGLPFILPVVLIISCGVKRL